MADIIASTDLPQEVIDATEATQLTLMVDGANAMGSRVAPCLDLTPSAGQLAEARIVLVGAVRRWAESGPGAFTQQVAGPFSVSTDTRQRAGFALWPSEITQLQDICASGGRSAGAFSFRITPATDGHLAWCDLAFGGTACSCGATLTGGVPIYEGG